MDFALSSRAAPNYSDLMNLMSSQVVASAQSGALTLAIVKAASDLQSTAMASVAVDAVATASAVALLQPTAPPSVTPGRPKKNGDSGLALGGGSPWLIVVRVCCASLHSNIVITALLFDGRL